MMKLIKVESQAKIKALETSRSEKKEVKRLEGIIASDANRINGLKRWV
jgi:hypothetical protein